MQQPAPAAPIILGEAGSGLPGPSNPMPGPSNTRSDAIKRYMEKKKLRKYGKKVRYPALKVRADVRKRMKGRFAKDGEACDYDPVKLKL